MKNKIKIAIVGCGHISKKHFNAIEKNSDQLELVSFCDDNQDVLLQMEKQHNVKSYVELNEMLKNEKIDLVALCTPSGKHATQTELCAKYGIHVITEKPMATSWKDGLRMVETCEKSKVYLFVVKQIRKNLKLQLLKKAISEKRFGKIHLVNINVFWNRPQEYYDQSNWRGTLKLDGGAFMNQASHYIDLLHWLIGPIDEIHSFMSTTRNIEAEDTGVLNIKWSNGALGSMNVTMLTYKKNLESSITIIGEKGTVCIGGLSVDKIKHWEFDNPKSYDNEINDLNKMKINNDGHSIYYKSVIDVLKGKAQPEIDGFEGLKSLEILTAAYLSAKDNLPVVLPLSNKHEL